MSATPWTKAGWPRRQKDWPGLTATTRRDMQNGMLAAPAGTVVKIDYVTSGERITIKAEPCDHCGRSVIMSRVSWRDLQLLRESNGR